ncbi:MAG: thiamine-monophosphate kinase [Candidatus Hydrogenedentota bacterium]
MRTLNDIGEFGFIEHIRKLLPTTNTVEEGIGDDCAVIRLFDHLLLATSDLFVEDVHFNRAYSPPNAIGWKAATAALSDIGAMGGAPLFCLVSLACPGDTTALFVEELYHGLSSAVSTHGAAIVGGDTTRSHSRISIDVSVIGHANTGRYITRRDARVGDLLAVTGRLGGSAGGLHALRNGQESDALIHAHLYPRALIEEGQWFCNHASVHALIDITDGLLQDCGHMTNHAVGVNLRADLIPLANELDGYCQSHGLNALELALTGGEDYELAFALDADAAGEVMDAFRREFRTEVHIIGEFTDSWNGVRLDGQAVDSSGFDHFKS